MAKEKGIVWWILSLVTILGALNWGLVGALKRNLVEAIVGTGIWATVIYIIVGLSAIYTLFKLFI